MVNSSDQHIVIDKLRKKTLSLEQVRPLYLFSFIPLNFIDQQKTQTTAICRGIGGEINIDSSLCPKIN